MTTSQVLRFRTRVHKAMTRNKSLDLTEELLTFLCKNKGEWYSMERLITELHPTAELSYEKTSDKSGKGILLDIVINTAKGLSIDLQKGSFEHALNELEKANMVEKNPVLSFGRQKLYYRCKT